MTMDGSVTMISLPYSKEVASGILGLSLMSILCNLYVFIRVYKKRALRNSCTAVIVFNLASVDIIVTLKDIPALLNVILSEKWRFEDTTCASYGLTSVIFIIVSVSTLATISSERFSRLRELSLREMGVDVSSNQHPLFLGFVIAHTTLSYSLSLLWSKYIFVSRKAFCRVEFQSQYGFSITFLSSFIFVFPVSGLMYSILYKSFLKNVELEEEKVNVYEKHAQKQIHTAIGIFLCSWTPYVVESLLSSHYQIPPNVGIAVACLPIFLTSFLPLYYVSFALPAEIVTKAAPMKIVYQ